MNQYFISTISPNMYKNLKRNHSSIYVFYFVDTGIRSLVKPNLSTELIFIIFSQYKYLEIKIDTYIYFDLF